MSEMHTRETGWQMTHAAGMASARTLPVFSDFQTAAASLQNSIAQNRLAENVSGRIPETRMGVASECQRCTSR